MARELVQPGMEQLLSSSSAVDKKLLAKELVHPGTGKTHDPSLKSACEL